MYHALCTLHYVSCPVYYNLAADGFFPCETWALRQLDLPKENWSTSDYEDCPVVRLSAAGAPVRTPDMRGLDQKRVAKGGKEPEGDRYAVSIVPNKSLTFDLVFRPQVVSAYAFELPLVLTGYTMSDPSCLNKVRGAGWAKSTPRKFFFSARRKLLYLRASAKSILLVRHASNPLESAAAVLSENPLRSEGGAWQKKAARQWPETLKPKP